ncbi:hypothetical protein, partial [Salibacterium qingdaonense]
SSFASTCSIDERTYRNPVGFFVLLQEHPFLKKRKRRQERKAALPAGRAAAEDPIKRRFFRLI